MFSNQLVKLDGSWGEGGGSIVRIALGLSALTGKPFEIINIRKGRCNPGLAHQHLFAVKAVKDLCNAVVDGDELHSTELIFYPKQIKGRTFSIDIQTAGSITLLLQSLLIPAVFADAKVRLKVSGGTDCLWSQPYDYFANVLVPQLRRFADIEPNLLRRGYYPAGRGKVELKIIPKYHLSDFPSFESFWQFLKENAPKVNLVEQKELLMVNGISHASVDLQKSEVAERQARAAKQFLIKLNCPIKITAEYSNTLSTGSGITLWAVFGDNETNEKQPVALGSDALGERGKRAEMVGKEAAENLLKEINSKAPVDHYLADQLLPFMALTGNSRIVTSELTNHCRTNIYTIEQFLGKCFDVDEAKNAIATLT